MDVFAELEPEPELSWAGSPARTESPTRTERPEKVGPPAGKSMFGPQAVSTRATAPAFGFGAGRREMPSNLYLSGAHQLDHHEENEVVGPGRYSLVSLLMQSKLSQHRSAPRLHFGTGKRFGEPGRGRRSDAKEPYPSPATYAAQMPAVGQQMISTRPNAAAYGFGSTTREKGGRVFISQIHSYGEAAGPGPAGKHAPRGTIGRPEIILVTRAARFSSDTRFKYEAEDKRRAATPGPGAYTAAGAIGRQAISSRATGAAFGFGSGDRTAQVYISAEHARHTPTSISPGPAAVRLPSAIGRQSYTTKSPNGSSWSFSKANRFGDARKDFAMASPGPGSYGI